MFGGLKRLLCRGMAQLVERLALDQEIGGSNPSTPAIFEITYPDLGKYPPIEKIRIKCLHCSKMTGIVTARCFDRRGSEKKDAAYLVACTSCYKSFRVIFNPLKCMGCDASPCCTFPFWNRWEI